MPLELVYKAWEQRVLQLFLILQNPFSILKGFCNLSQRQYGELEDPFEKIVLQP